MCAERSTTRIAHADSTTIFEHLKMQDRRSRVESVLAEYDLYTVSSFSRLEFRRAWIRAIGVLVAYSKADGVATINDLHAHLNARLSGRHNNRLRSTATEILTAVCEALPRLQLTARASLSRLRLYLEQAIILAAEHFDRLATYRTHGTECARALEAIYTEYDDGTVAESIKRCYTDDIKCNVHGFFSDHADDIAGIITELRSYDEARHSGLCMRLEAALADPRLLCDGTECRRVGDCLIALDGKKADEFVANNDDDWRPISKALEKSLLNPVSGSRFNQHGSSGLESSPEKRPTAGG